MYALDIDALLNEMGFVYFLRAENQKYAKRKSPTYCFHYSHGGIFHPRVMTGFSFMAALGVDFVESYLQPTPLARLLLPLNGASFIA